MYITREEMKATRLKLVKEMNAYILNTGDEDIYETWWMVGVPDGADEEDFEFFTDADEFKELCKLFGKLACRDEKENY